MMLLTKENESVTKRIIRAKVSQKANKDLLAV